MLHIPLDLKNMFYQRIRVADVFLVGPMLMFAATKFTRQPVIMILFFAVGAATIIFNGLNYLKISNK